MCSVFARVQVTYLENPRSTDQGCSLLFDVKLDENRNIVGKWQIFVVCTVEKKPYPFILKDDGTIDFGSVEDDNIAYFATLISRHPQIRVGAIANGRYWKTNIRNKEIRKDELVTITENDDEECTYKITSVAVLGEGPI